MRVRATKKLKGEISVVLFSKTGPHLMLTARVVWTQRLSFRKHLVGLEFVNPPDHVDPRADEDRHGELHRPLIDETGRT